MPTTILLIRQVCIYSGPGQSEANGGLFPDQEGNTEDRPERTMSVRQRQEIQEVLRRMNAQDCTFLRPSCQATSRFPPWTNAHRSKPSTSDNGRHAFLERNRSRRRRSTFEELA